MELNYENFWQEYPRLVSLLLPPLEPEDGFSEAEVAAAEKRLGISLPALLREFYLRAGQRFDVNHALHQLMSPDELEIRGKRFLFFYDENQSVMWWGIPLDSLSEPDPPVWSTYDNDGNWDAFEPRLSSFLGIMLLDQATTEMPAAGGDGQTTRQDFYRVTADWEQLLGSFQIGAVKPGASLIFCADAEEETGTVRGGCTTQEEGDFLMQELNMGFGVYDFEEEE